MKSLKKFLILPLFSTLLFSCEKETIVPDGFSYNYFPTDVGRYVVYDVDSIYHADNDNNTDDSVYLTHFQLKEVIAKTFMDGENRPTQIVYRYRRNSVSQEWIVISACTQLLTDKGAYRTEDNVVLHKLAFPMNSTINWNGNDANTLREELYRYEDLYTPYSSGTVSFDSTVSVIQVDESNFIEEIYGEEIYSNRVGLIHKERINLRKINGMVVKGTEFKMTAVSYGVN